MPARSPRDVAFGAVAALGSSLCRAAARLLAGVASLLAAACASSGAPEGERLDPTHLRPIAFGGEGAVTPWSDGIELGAGSTLTGVRWEGAELPTVDYEIALEATRVRGGDFFCGLTFPVREGHCTLVLGGWGGSLVGLSCLDGADASANETTTYASFEDGRPYRVRVRVTSERIVATVDERRLVDAAIAGREVTLRPDVRLTAPLGVCSYATVARIRDLRLRKLEPGGR